VNRHPQVVGRKQVGIVAQSGSAEQGSGHLRRVLAPLALAQFICSFAGSNMNVMITDISEDLNTTVQGVQIAITIFLLVMAALMIPGGKLTDRYGRKRLFMLGLVIYGVGALLSAVSPGLGVLIIGNSILEGVGTALLIPPVYILTTLLFTEVTSRARAFGVISALGGVGAAAGPLLGGLITSAISWRAAFVFQALIIAVIVLLSRRIKDPLPPDPSRSFDTGGAILSAIGLVLVVMGILAADNSIWLTVILIVVGALVLVLFFRSVRAKERAGKEPLLSTSLFRNRTSNLGLVTQNTQWLMLMGTSFVVSAYLQVVRGYNAIQTGVIFTAATVGLLVSSLAAERLAKRYAQRTLILAGFVLTIAGVAVLLFFVSGSPTAWAFAPGLLLIGLGLGAMLTPSVNVVQSSFPDSQQGEISGLSRSVSNLGSCLGTAVAGTILVAGITATPGRAYALAMTALGVVGVIGLVAAVLLPSEFRTATAQDVPQQDGPGDREGVIDNAS
jgi:MFS family permease